MQTIAQKRVTLSHSIDADYRAKRVTLSHSIDADYRAKKSDIKSLFFACWYRRLDSNQHGLPHYPLKIACLPIPPLRLVFGLTGLLTLLREGPHHYLSILPDQKRLLLRVSLVALVPHQHPDLYPKPNLLLFVRRRQAISL